MRITTVLWVLCSIGAVALGAGTGTLLVNSTKGKTGGMFAFQSTEKPATASLVSAPAKPETPKIESAPASAPKTDAVKKPDPAKPEPKAAKPAPRTSSPAETAPKPTADAAAKKKERAAKRRSSDDD